MRYWETAPTDQDQPAYLADYARIWQAADKIVFSTTLEDAPTARTKLERRFDPDAIRAMKAASDRDLGVGGPGLAATAIRAGLVDELRQVRRTGDRRGRHVVPAAGRPARPRARRRTTVPERHRLASLPGRDVMAHFGLQLPSFTFADVPDDRLFERIAEIARRGRGRRVRFVLGDGPLPPDREHRAADRPDARGVHAARRGRRAHLPDPARRDGHRRDVSQPRVPREGGHDARRGVVGPGDPRDRRRLERGGIPRVRLRLAAGGRAVRAARGRAADLPVDVHAAGVDRATARCTTSTAR